MKEMTLGTLLAVFEDMFGFWLFWGLVAAAAAVTALYLYVLVRDRHVGWRKFLVAQLFMPVGAALAVLFVMWITHSHLRDIGGPVDVIILLGIAGLGAVGMAISSTRSSRSSRAGATGAAREAHELGYSDTLISTH